ncbi:MAG: HAD-IIIA family hydrolase [Acidobacteriota bacterium]
MCGGRGTRLAPSIGDLPKILTPLGGRSVLEHLLRDLAASLGQADVLLLAGVGGERVAEAARALAPPGLEVATLIEEKPLGTAGALHAAAGRLAERFAFVCGDILTSLDWRRFWDFARQQGGLGTLLVHRSSHPEDSDLVILDDLDRAVGWSRRGARGHSGSISAGGPLGNAGLAVLSREILRSIPRDRRSDLFRDIMPPLVDRRAPLFGYRTPEFVKDMGTPERLVSVDEEVRSGRVLLKAELALLDRDGVINVERDALLTRAEDLELIPGAAAGIRRLNRAGIRAAVVTNQAVVARGLCSLEELGRIHDRLRELLRREGASVEKIYFCPHHPETDHGEGIAELRGPCGCRKPSTGMVERALEELGVPPWRAILVGDRTSDMQLAANAGLASIAVETGCGLRDQKCPARPVWTFSDLATACAWLSSNARVDGSLDRRPEAASHPAANPRPA